MQDTEYQSRTKRERVGELIEEILTRFITCYLHHSGTFLPRIATWTNEGKEFIHLQGGISCMKRWKSGLGRAIPCTSRCLATIPNTSINHL